jgi:hypothetical protein
MSNINNSLPTFGLNKTGNQGFFNRTGDRIKGAFSGTKDFLDSNSIVAKLAFVLLIVFAFYFVLMLGTKIMTYFLAPSPKPILIDGMIDANQQKVFPQNPQLANSVPIMRSFNKTKGAEFTWSVWVFIKNLAPHGKYKHIFHKGNDIIATDKTASALKAGAGPGMNFPNNAPGLYLDENTNKLVVVMNTFDNIQEEIEIDDIPLNKWVNVMIRLENTTLDVYVNGTIVKRHILSGVPKQNYGDVYVTMNGGFNGNLSNLRYWNHALDVSEIQSIINTGPNMKSVDKDMTQSTPHYFSLRWYFDQDGGSSSDFGGL